MVDPTVSELVSKSKWEDKIAGGRIDGEKVTFQAKVAGRRSNPRVSKGTPYIRISVPGDEEYETFDSVEAMADRFEELCDEHGFEAREIDR